MLYSNSRYIKTKTYIDMSGATVFYNRATQTFNPEKCTRYLVKGFDTLETIAFEKLGDVNYKWAILDCNPHYLTELNIKPGDTILIPNIDDVRYFYAK